MLNLISGALVLLFLSVCCLAETGQKPGTLTGGFADQKCAQPRAAAGAFTRNNPDCARKCIENGAAAVFIDEKGKTLLTVVKYANVKDDLGYYLEVSGVVDAASHTITIANVRRLAEAGPSCARPKAKAN